jgi:hypothetical protein
MDVAEQIADDDDDADEDFEADDTPATPGLVHVDDTAREMGTTDFNEVITPEYLQGASLLAHLIPLSPPPS